jgi:hypothetical protein
VVPLATDLSPGHGGGADRDDTLNFGARHAGENSAGASGRYSDVGAGEGTEAGDDCYRPLERFRKLAVVVVTQVSDDDAGAR